MFRVYQVNKCYAQCDSILIQKKNVEKTDQAKWSKHKPNG